MIGIKIVEKSGRSYPASVKKLSDVFKVVNYPEIQEISIIAITPREYQYFKTVVNSNKIKVIR